MLCRQIRWVALMVIPIHWDRRDANVLVWLQLPVKNDWKRRVPLTYGTLTYWGGVRTRKLRNPTQILV